MISRILEQKGKSIDEKEKICCKRRSKDKVTNVEVTKKLIKLIEEKK